MSRVFLKEVSIAAFRSFVDTSTVKFGPNGLVLFKGKNKDTGGSSGSGKSSVNLAIAYALGIAPFAATALQSWLTDKPMEVQLTLASDSEEVVIKRGQKLTMTINGTQVAGGAKIVEARLSQFLGVGQDVLSALTYRGQLKPGLFLSKGDAEKKEFLTTLLDLSGFEDAIEQTQQAIKDLEPKVDGVEATLSSLANMAELYRPVEPSIEDVHDDTRLVSELAKTIEARTNEIDAKKASLSMEAAQIISTSEAQIASAESSIISSKLSVFVQDDLELRNLQGVSAACKERLDKAEARWQSVKEEWEKDKASRQESCQKVRIAISSEQQLMHDLTSLNSGLKILLANKCPTCYREWHDLNEKKQEYLDKIKGIEEALGTIASQKDELTKLVSLLQQMAPPTPDSVHQQLLKAYQDLSSRVTEATWRKEAAEYEFNSAKAFEIATKQAEIQKLKFDQKESIAQLPGAAAIALLLKQSQEDVALKAEIESRIRGTVMANRAKEEAYQSDLAKYQRISMEHSLAKANASKQRAQLNQERDFLSLVGREGFLGSIFDEVLSEISYETNQILASVANTRHCTLHFRSESTTQKGTNKKAIVPYITVGGHEAPLASGLSGGMIRAVELAVDLAIGAVINRRTGSYPSWLVLDECFEGLGTIEKESCMEILQRYSADKLILVVDHSSEFQEMFSQQINVEFENGYSTIGAVQ